MRKFIAETCMEFHEFMSDQDNFPLNKRNDKAIIFNSFVQEYKDYEKYLTRKRFHIWVSKYASFIKADFDSGNTNGLKWFEINNGGETKNEEVPF